MTREPLASDAAPSPRSRADDAVAGVVAGAACVAAGHPFDTVKVHAQKNPGRTIGRAIASICRERGARGLYAGVGAPLVGASLETGANYACFHEAREAALRATSGGGSEARLAASAFAGALAGGIMTPFLTPFELVKCRAQVGDGGGSARRVALDVWRTRGASGLFRGVSHTAAREIPSGAVYFATYEIFQAMFPRARGASDVGGDATRVAFETRDADGALVEALAAASCGGAAGVVTWLVVLPLDNVKTIYQCERPGGARDLTPSALLRALVAERGVSGLWRGAAPIVARAFPANAAQWLAWEFASRALRDRRLDALERA